MNAQQKLAALRGAMQAAEVDGFILPVADEFLGEYLPASSQRLAWLTGFTGSAGTVAVLAEKAALFVDGRYTLQAKQEVPLVLYTQFNSGDTSHEQWLAEHMPENGVLGYDARLHSQREVERLTRALKGKGVRLLPLALNPVDELWEDRPAPPDSKVLAHGVEYAGEEHGAKLARVGKVLHEAGAHVAVLVASDSVNWLLNIRGADLTYSPLVLACALVYDSGRATLYIDPDRVEASLYSQLMPGVSIRPPATLDEDLAELGRHKQHVLADPVLTPAWFVQKLEQAGALVVFADDPCQKMKAVKNSVELEGMRSAHLRDGLALTKFLCWLMHETSRRDLTEREASLRLLEFRKAAHGFISPSFETIAGSGPNGAIVHYRVTSQTNRVLHQNELFLLDSGGQYPDGTTDVTRTLAIGEPGPEQRERYTLVLKGHIALAMARFPAGTAGGQLDALARRALWAAGLDYDHGTGHGVGAALNVHEGPQRIGKRASGVALEEGMIVSNEPGYYREGHYGIRIENLVEVVRLGAMESGKAMLGFRTLTCAPLDLKLIDPALLLREEKQWLDDYHGWVHNTLQPDLNEDERQWLAQATRRVG